LPGFTILATLGIQFQIFLSTSVLQTTPFEYAALKAIQRLMRKYRAAQKSLERFEKAVAAVEKPQKRRAGAPLLLLADHTSMKKEQGD
jgi:hypothetical protein